MLSTILQMIMAIGFIALMALIWRIGRRHDGVSVWY
jgi:hypothetical protein